MEGYYILGAPCMMKRNISPPLGYANGSQGKMIGIVPKEGDVLPSGDPGEMIMIEPPEFIIMEVSHKKGDDRWTTIVPCKLKKVSLDYKRDGKDKKFSCMSNCVNLMFAFTIHETQGQTLEKVILLLGRMPGLNVGQITWSLLYVALSRTRELKDIKFFPCSWQGLSNFKHLTRLKPSSSFVKWNSGYRDHVWCPDILETQNLRNEKYVENKLVRQGPAVSLQRINDILIGYLSGLGYKVLKKTERYELQTRLMVHMERKSLWKLGKDKDKFYSKRGTRKRLIPEVKKKAPRKSRKLSHGKKNGSLNLVEKPGSVKGKRKFPKKIIFSNKKKSKGKKKKVDLLPERFLYPDELIFEKFLLDRKGYRIDPIKRDGNCLFRAVAACVHHDSSKYTRVKKECIRFMKKEKEYFRPYIEIDGVLYNKYISQLSSDGAWGGNNELIALSGVFKCVIEVYDNSDEPTVLRFSGVDANTPSILRLLYKNSHYSAIRSDGVGDQLFNFEQVQEGELEWQMELLYNSKKPHIDMEFKEHSSNDDSELAEAIKLSISADEAEKSYLRFYASKITKKS